MKRIALYDRFKLYDAETPEIHRKMVDGCRKQIAKEGNKIVDNFFDNCSEHIPVDERPEYKRMYDMCVDGEVDEVWVTSLSRISRKMSLIADMCKKMHEIGIKVVFANEKVTSEQLLNSPVVQKISEGIELGMGM